MSQRTPLVLLCLAVLGASALVAWRLSTRGDAPAAPAAARASGAEAADRPRATPVVASLPPRVDQAPRLPPAEAAGSGDGVREYAVGDVVVRDHRAGAAPLDTPPSVHPPDGRRLPAALTGALGQQLQQAAVACASAVPPEARGPRPRFEGEVQVAIVDHVAKVIGSTLALRDVAGASVEPVLACARQAMLAHAVPAPDEADLAKYPITVRFAIP